MRVLWICGLPARLSRESPECHGCRANAEWSWILGHLPPPTGLNLHIACPVTSGPWGSRSFSYQGATFHLVRCLKGRLQTGYLFDPLFFRALYARIRPDVVHGWGTEDSNSIIAQKLAPNTHVVQVQGLITDYSRHLGMPISLRYVAMRERMALRKARNVFVESQYSRQITQPYCGEGTHTWQLDHPLRDEFINSLPSRRDAKQVLFLGRLIEAKGYLDALAAFSAAPPEWSFVMIGSGSTEAVTKLNMAIDTFQLRNRFRHLQSAGAPEVVEQMQASSIYLLPSYMDTGPTSLKEALAMNLWPICYNNSGPAEFVTRFNLGTLSRTGDILALQTALLNVMRHLQSNDTTNFVACSEARKAFSKNVIWPQLLDAYSVIGKVKLD